MHQNKEKEEQKPVDADRFVQYVRDKLVPVLGNYSRREPHSVVIMDNCSIHLDERVTELIESTGAIIIYSSPYSPELIPIEFMFGQWKKFLKRYTEDFQRNWYEVHSLGLLSITPQQGLNYFKHTTLVNLVENHPLSENYKQQEVETIAIVLTVALSVGFLN